MENQKKRILHVEDEEAIRYLVKRALSEYEVVSAHNLEDAKEKAKEYFDLYIIDGCFPSNEKGLAGICFYEHIKSKAKPCIFISSEETMAKKATELGIKYLPKPFELNELNMAVNESLKD